MDLEWIRRTCLALPGATDHIQWGNDLVFKAHGKIFAVAALEPDGRALTFKCTPEEFAGLRERPGFVPARYQARAKWITLESIDTLPLREVQRLLRQSYDLVTRKAHRKARAAGSSM
ncbi:MAG: MmcQ/YjbR family DNA-binding protein [Bryobacteraceae bacterium]